MRGGVGGGGRREGEGLRVMSTLNGHWTFLKKRRRFSSDPLKIRITKLSWPSKSIWPGSSAAVGVTERTVRAHIHLFFHIKEQFYENNKAQIYPKIKNKIRTIEVRLQMHNRVSCTLSDNRIAQNYLAFSRITGNSKQDFTLTKKSKFEITRT